MLSTSCFSVPNSDDHDTVESTSTASPPPDDLNHEIFQQLLKHCPTIFPPTGAYSYPIRVAVSPPAEFFSSHRSSTHPTYTTELYFSVERADSADDLLPASLEMHHRRLVSANSIQYESAEDAEIIIDRDVVYRALNQNQRCSSPRSPVIADHNDYYYTAALGKVPGPSQQRNHDVPQTVLTKGGRRIKLSAWVQFTLLAAPNGLEKDAVIDGARAVALYLATEQPNPRELVTGGKNGETPPIDSYAFADFNSMHHRVPSHDRLVSTTQDIALQAQSFGISVSLDDRDRELADGVPNTSTGTIMRLKESRADHYTRLSTALSRLEAAVDDAAAFHRSQSTQQNQPQLQPVLIFSARSRTPSPTVKQHSANTKGTGVMLARTSTSGSLVREGSLGGVASLSPTNMFQYSRNTSVNRHHRRTSSLSLSPSHCTAHRFNRLSPRPSSQVRTGSPRSTFNGYNVEKRATIAEDRTNTPMSMLLAPFGSGQYPSTTRLLFHHVPKVITSFNPFDISLTIHNAASYPVYFYTDRIKQKKKSNTKPFRGGKASLRITVAVEADDPCTGRPHVVHRRCDFVPIGTADTPKPIEWAIVHNLCFTSTGSDDSGGLDESNHLTGLYRVSGMSAESPWAAHAVSEPCIGPCHHQRALDNAGAEISSSAQRFTGLTFRIANFCKAIVGLRCVDHDFEENNTDQQNAFRNTHVDPQTWRTYDYSVHISTAVSPHGHGKVMQLRIYELGEFVREIGTHAINIHDSVSMAFVTPDAGRQPFFVYTLNETTIIRALPLKRAVALHRVCVKLATQTAGPALDRIYRLTGRPHLQVAIRGLYWKGGSSQDLLNSHPDRHGLRVVLRAWFVGEVTDTIPANASVELILRSPPLWGVGAASLACMFAAGAFGMRGGEATEALAALIKSDQNLPTNEGPLSFLF